MISGKRAKTLMNLSLIIAIIGGGFMVYHFPNTESSLGKILNFGGLGSAVVFYIYGRTLPPAEDEELHTDEEE